MSRLPPVSKTVVEKKPVKKQTTAKKKAPAKSITYRVVAGDSLWSISQKYKTTVDNLKKWNKLNTNNLFIGQLLYVNSVSSVATAAVSSTAKNVKNLRTKTQAVTYAKSLVGKGWDYDNAYGWQCFDAGNMYWHYMFSHGLKGVGAKDIPTWNDFTGEAKVIRYTSGVTAQVGDLVVWGGSFNGNYGHVAIVIEVYNGGFKAVNQNWFGGGYTKTEVATVQNHPYFNEMWFIRPIFR